MYAAFQRFVFQEAELHHAIENPGFFDIAKYFARRIVEYDFWDNTEMWDLIGDYGRCVRRFLASGEPEIRAMEWTDANGPAASTADAERYVRWRERADVLELWRRLALLPRNYEDVNREWFLPTGLGYVASYPKGTA